MNIVLFDGEERENLLPLTFTKPVASLRMGVLTFTKHQKKLLKTTKIKKKDCELYISLIFHLLNNENLESLYENYVLSDDDKVEFKIDGKTYTEKKNDYLILIKYAEMVSPF